MRNRPTLADEDQHTLEILARLHQIFDVVDCGKVDSQKLKKLALVSGKILVCEYFHQVAEVVAGVEAEPLDVVHQDDARGHQ